MDADPMEVVVQTVLRSIEAKSGNFSGGPRGAHAGLIFASRSIECTGGPAVNMGENAVFLDEARDIRHEHRKQANVDENPGA